ncbi:roadblock/LC7 domain-containing protein [Acinetobacter sp. C26M]|uniref:roadblock/LC7 domain-containing protein n=1 Tax=unclassified Acinetobacter TaxID=196816 RepID=UPI002036A296|nr:MULTISPECIES: roadblock/LC7 domain-containing protein [unclassified Acinetobacter]USA48192.1 roadblock/LC7 domain-containing protein [Acinetobacter sp. C26M]USA51672.1 roadblock/LC7 domain-containing protein [Acinetobacter sp. C26G]
MNNISLLKQLNKIEGLIVLALVDAFDGSILETIGDEFFNVDLAATEGVNLFNYQKQLMNEIDPDDFLESVLMSTNHQYHIITPLETNHSLFLYTILDRDQTNLGYATYEIQRIERGLNFYTY